MNGAPYEYVGLVAAGGALGAVLRALALRLGSERAWLPYATLAVNAAGSFALGWSSADASPILAAAFGAGALGGFTTYSTFALETAELARKSGGPLRASTYVALTIAGSVAAAALGRSLA